MFKVNEGSVGAPLGQVGATTGVTTGGAADDEAIDARAFYEEALARDAALQAGGPVLEWRAFEAWVRSRLADRLGSLPPSLLPGA